MSFVKGSGTNSGKAGKSSGEAHEAIPFPQRQEAQLLRSSLRMGLRRSSEGHPQVIYKSQCQCKQAPDLERNYI